MKKFICFCALSLSFSGFAIENNVTGSLLFRYENETSHQFLPDRERLRLIGQLSLKSSFNEIWSSNVSLRTGLKNKQNVPAITLLKFNQQPSPDKDVFIDRLFVTAKFSNLTIIAGKIPWKTEQVTDLFWDRHLNPIGFHGSIKLGPSDKVQFASFKPLDGNSNTIGHMNVLQYHHVFDLENIQFKVSPWFVDYRGEENAEFAKKDTQFDNQFLRLSMTAKYGKYRLGLDLGKGLDTPVTQEFDDLSDQKSSYAAELRYGHLKQIGDVQWHIRYLHVERFSVVSEFAQNAVSRFSTSNIKGMDFRLRRKMSDNWWLGTRLSRTRNLVGEIEKGTRFRVETQYRF